MEAVAITGSISALHADIETQDRFEGIWLIPHGVSLNSYVVRGEKVALIDLAKDWGGSIASLEGQLKSAGASFESVDYLVLNHLEPDHAAFISELHRRNPSAEIVSTAKGIALVRNFFKIEGRCRAVKTGDELDLGGKKLAFCEAPNVHWPETMVTYDPADKVLFSCDAFGSYGKLGERVFDDEFSAEEHKAFEEECLRYYSNIVASFSPFLNKAIEAISSLDIGVIAPSHGIIWRKDPQEIVRRYARYAGYNTGGALEREICVIWGSMYGYTKAGVDAVIEGIESEGGVPVTMHRVPDEDASFVLADAYKSAGLVLAMPTYEYKMFPPMAYVLDLFARKRFAGKRALRIGSWGWAGGAKKEYDDKTAPLKWDHLPAYEWQGAPSCEDLAALKDLGAQLAAAVKG